MTRHDDHLLEAMSRIDGTLSGLITQLTAYTSGPLQRRNIEEVRTENREHFGALMDAISELRTDLTSHVH